MSDLCQQLAREHVEDYLEYSGHFFAQMGDYVDCSQLPFDSSYFKANYINNITKISARMYTGLCLPSQCTGDYVKTIMNEELENINPVVQQLVGYPMAVGSIQVNPQDIKYDVSGWLYVTIVLLAFLFLMGVFAVVRGKMGKKKEKKNISDKIVESFDYSQSLKIFAYKHNYLNIFNGIKTISMLWVIFGHLFSVRLQNDDNIAGIPTIVEKFFFCFVTGAFLAVDVFFFIGGFLVAYSFMREKSKSLMKYPMAIVHRLLRFWPSYIVVIMFYYSIVIHTGEGPIWEQHNTTGQIPDCQGAWKTLLFVDNLVDNGEHMCLPWGWYLQNDMQIFVFSLVFILIYVKNRIAGYISIALMIFVGLGLNIYEVIHREIKQVTHLIDFVKWAQYFTSIYIKPWIRCPPYLLGLIFGLLHMEYLAVKKKLADDPEDKKANANFYVRLRKLMQKRRWVSWVFQLMGVAFMITTVVIPHNMQLGNTWPYWAHGLYLSGEKISFTFGVYLLILPTLLEIPTISFFLLDTRFFNFTGKISFWVYLMHLMVVERVCFGQKVDFYYTAEDVIPLYGGIAVISMCLGFIGTMLVEVPFSKLQKLLFSAMLKKKDRPKIIQNAASINEAPSQKSFLSETSPSTIVKNSTLLSSGNNLEQELLEDKPDRHSIQ